ncbi:DHHC palmitoyltransferase-domain-containing protein [Lyophyllum atratum]|nr:DHHC palmitoyltransferase-domain-containing protein [Lyophyllum atratum]
MTWCSRTVFRCFKALERAGDRLTGAAGPFFVGLAIILITTGTVCFFDVIMPSLSYPIITLPICLLITFNLFMHYFYVCTVKPGFVDDPPAEPGRNILWARRSKPPKGKALMGGARWSSVLNVTRAETTQCSKCGQTKPERTHHCRICNRCVLKYDHHCPVRINQCVGLHNERHFVMFMAYLVLSTFCVTVLGYKQVFEALGVTYTKWTYHVPEIAYIITYLLSLVLFLAVGIMLSYHMYSISWGETSVEGQDHDVYRRKAKARGEVFTDFLHRKRRNLQLFFNIGEAGYPLYTLFFPFRINPYTDGRSWARREGYERHHGVRRGEELTDEEDDDE